MPVYDRRCSDCGHIEKDKIEAIGASDYDCVQPYEIRLDGVVLSTCKGVMLRTWLPGSANGVVDDSIPGGMEIKNALCNPDGTPRRFDSHSDIKRAAAEAGWTNVVEHIPMRGSDKSPHTTRWVGLPQGLDPKAEAERVAAWHAHEDKLISDSST
jgi:hypothetical protein